MKQYAEAFGTYVPLLQTFLWCLIILFGILIFKESIINLLSTLEKRIKGGASFKVAGVELKNDFNTTTEDAKLKYKDDLKIYGNPDHFQLLFKATSSNWSNSTKALETPLGCLVQVTNEQKQADGSWIPAEALTFIPGVIIKDETDGKGRYLVAKEENKHDIP